MSVKWASAMACSGISWVFSTQYNFSHLSAWRDPLWFEHATLTILRSFQYCRGTFLLHFAVARGEFRKATAGQPSPHNLEEVCIYIEALVWERSLRSAEGTGQQLVATDHLLLGYPAKLPRICGVALQTAQWVTWYASSASDLQTVPCVFPSYSSYRQVRHCLVQQCRMQLVCRCCSCCIAFMPAVKPVLPQLCLFPWH